MNAIWESGETPVKNLIRSIKESVFIGSFSPIILIVFSIALAKLWKKINLSFQKILNNYWSGRRNNTRQEIQPRYIFITPTSDSKLLSYFKENSFVEKSYPQTSSNKESGIPAFWQLVSNEIFVVDSGRVEILKI